MINILPRHLHLEKIFYRWEIGHRSRCRDKLCMLKAKYQRDISCENGRPLLGRKFLCRQQIDRPSRRVLIKRAPSVCRRPSSETSKRGKLDLSE